MVFNVSHGQHQAVRGQEAAMSPSARPPAKQDATVECALRHASLVSYDRPEMTVVPSGLMALDPGYGLEESTHLKDLLGSGSAHLNATLLTSTRSFQTVMQFALPKMNSTNPQVMASRERALGLLARGLHQQDVKHMVVVDGPGKTSEFLDKDYHIASGENEPLGTDWVVRDGKLNVRLDLPEGKEAHVQEVGISHINLKAAPETIFATIKHAHAEAEAAGGGIATGCPSGSTLAGVATLLLGQRKLAESMAQSGRPATKAQLMQLAQADETNGKQQRGSHFATGLPPKLLEMHADALVTEMASRQSTASERESDIFVDMAAIGRGVPLPDPSSRKAPPPPPPRPHASQPITMAGSKPAPATTDRKSPPPVAAKTHTVADSGDIYSRPMPRPDSPRTALHRQSVMLNKAIDRMATGPSSRASQSLDAGWSKWMNPANASGEALDDFSKAVANDFCVEASRGFRLFATRGSYGVGAGVGKLQAQVGGEKWAGMIDEIFDHANNTGLTTPEQKDAAIFNLFDNKMKAVYDGMPPALQGKWRHRAGTDYFDEVIHRAGEECKSLLKQSELRNADMKQIKQEMGTLQMSVYVMEAMRNVGTAARSGSPTAKEGR